MGSGRNLVDNNVKGGSYSETNNNAKENSEIRAKINIRNIVMIIIYTNYFIIYQVI